MEFTPEERKRVHLIFTAHSLPKSIVENDPYARRWRSVLKEFSKDSSLQPGIWLFRAREVEPEEWVGPDVESVLTDFRRKKVREILIVPIGFVSDHIEDSLRY